MVTRDQFERYHAEYFNLVVSTAEDAVSPIRQALSTLTTRVEVLESSGDFIRDTNDPALRRIAVLGIESKDPAVRIAAIGEWLRGNLPDVRRDQTDRKESEMFHSAHIEFSDYSLCEIALVKLTDKPPLNISGKNVDFRRAVTKDASA